MIHRRLRIGALLCGALLLAVVHGLAQDPPKPMPLNADDRKALQAACETLRRADSDAVAGAEKAIVELAARGDVEEPLQLLVVGDNLEAALRARRILNKLGKEILGHEYFRRKWAAEGPAKPPENTPNPAPQPPVAEKAKPSLNALLAAPKFVALHGKPAAGHYVKMGLFAAHAADGDTPASEDTWAVVEVTADRVWVEHHTAIIEPVVMLLEIERATGAVFRAFGRVKAADEAGPFSDLPLLRLGWHEAARPLGKGVESAPQQTPAGDWPDAQVLSTDDGGTVAVSPNAYFAGVIWQRDSSGRFASLLIEQGAAYSRRAWPIKVVRVVFQGQLYDVPDADYRAFEEEYAAGRHKPPKDCPPIGARDRPAFPFSPRQIR